MSTHAVTPLRHRMIEDMNARKLCAGTQQGHIHSCKRFAVFLNRSPDTATTEDIRRFQLHLAEAETARKQNTLSAAIDRYLVERPRDKSRRPMRHEYLVETRRTLEI